MSSDMKPRGVTSSRRLGLRYSKSTIWGTCCIIRVIVSIVYRDIATISKISEVLLQSTTVLIVVGGVFR